MSALPACLTNRNSFWWHQFCTASWYAAACGLVAHRAMAQLPLRKIRAKMVKRQKAINRFVSILKSLLSVDPASMDYRFIEDTLLTIQMLLRAQELDGREILAAVVAFDPA